MLGTRAPVLLVLIAASAAGPASAQDNSLPPGPPYPLTTVVDYEPGWHPAGDRLVFVSNRTGALKIWTLHVKSDPVRQLVDDPLLRQLTQGKEEDDSPAWSPDGTRIAYVSMKGGNSEIYVMRADGRRPVRLTRHVSDDVHPQWSPDGSRILWNSSRNSTDRSNPDTYELFTMKPDGTDVRQLTRGGIRTYASYSPDGTKILFRRQIEGDNSDIFVMHADGSGETNLTRHAAFDGWPAWSRDGKRIVFAREEEVRDNAKIYVMNVDGSETRVLVDLPGRNTNPRWSPTEDRIVFSTRSDKQVRLHALIVEPAR